MIPHAEHEVGLPRRVLRGEEIASHRRCAVILWLIADWHAMDITERALGAFVVVLSDGGSGVEGEAAEFDREGGVGAGLWLISEGAGELYP